MPPSARCSRMTYRLSMVRPTSDGADTDTLKVYEPRASAPVTARHRRLLLSETMHQGPDVPDVPPGVRIGSVLAHGAEPLVVAADRLVQVFRVAGEVPQDRDAGGDVVVCVHQVQLATDHRRCPFAGLR